MEIHISELMEYRPTLEEARRIAREGTYKVLPVSCEILVSSIAEAVERGDFDAGVLIHEGRFVYERRNLELVADLGIEWERMTDMPLPLGGIVLRRELGEELRQKVERVLRRSIEYAFANPTSSRDYVKAHAQELDDDVIDKHIALFVNEFSLSLGEQGRQAIAYLTGEVPE